MTAAGRLVGQVAVVTGGGRGIGRAVCEALAREGARVAPFARHVDDTRAVAEAIRARGEGDRALALAGDVGVYGQGERAVADVVRARGRLDIVVNAAGAIAPIGRTWAADPEEWGRNVTTNLVGAFNVCRAALPALLAQRSGCVVNVSSGAARNPVAGWGAYCAAKAGLDHFTRVLIEETRGTGVRVAVVYPGVVDTGMQDTIRDADEEGFGPDNLARFRRYKAEGMLRRPEEPAALIAWMAATPEVDGEFLSVDDPATMERAGLPLGTRRG